MTDYRKMTFDAIDEALNDESIPQDIRDAVLVVRAHLTIKTSARMTSTGAKASMKYKRRVLRSELRMGLVKRTELVDLTTMTIIYSTKVMPRMSDEEREDTVKHELAHVIDYVQRGESDHGYLWQRIHVALGGSAERCHKVDVSDMRRPRKRFKIKHKDTGYERVVTAQRAKRLSYSYDVIEAYMIDGKGKRIP